MLELYQEVEEEDEAEVEDRHRQRDLQDHLRHQDLQGPSHSNQSFKGAS